MRYIILLLANTFIFAQCKTDSGVTSQSPPTAAPSLAEAPAAGTTMDAMNWTFLTDGVFHNQMAVIVGESLNANPWEGHWVNFKEDGTFEYGEWDKKTYEGSWHYDNSTTVLVMTTTDGTAQNSEWRVLHKNDDMVWQGTSTYGNNSTQAKWLRSEGYPSPVN